MPISLADGAVANPVQAQAPDSSQDPSALTGELGIIPRPDGGRSTEISITVPAPRLNGGKPTNIPTLVRGPQDVEALVRTMRPSPEQEEIAIQRAVERQSNGAALPSYSTIEEAVAAARSRSDQGGSTNKFQGGGTQRLDLSRGAIADQSQAIQTKPHKIVAIDLDGTLADAGPGGSLGAPRPESLDLVKHLQEQGAEVRIFTARATTPAGQNMVRAWLGLHGFPAVPITATKDPDVGVYLDDRAVRYEPGQAAKSLASGLMKTEPHWKDTSASGVTPPPSEPSPTTAMPLHQYIDMMTGRAAGEGTLPGTPSSSGTLSPVSKALSSLAEAEQARPLGTVAAEAP